jgi:heptosyltransferase-2
LPVVLPGSGNEFEPCEAIAAPVNTAQPGKCINLAGKPPLAGAFITTIATKNIVSNNSRLMHVAAAFGVRQIALFGSSNPLHAPPLNDQATVM